jgi:hypothetical protein
MPAPPALANVASTSIATTERRTDPPRVLRRAPSGGARLVQRLRELTPLRAEPLRLGACPPRVVLRLQHERLAVRQRGADRFRLRTAAPLVLGRGREVARAAERVLAFGGLALGERVQAPGLLLGVPRRRQLRLERREPGARLDRRVALPAADSSWATRSACSEAASAARAARAPRPRSRRLGRLQHCRVIGGAALLVAQDDALRGGERRAHGLELVHGSRARRLAPPRLSSASSTAPLGDATCAGWGVTRSASSAAIRRSRSASAVSASAARCRPR